MRLRRELVQSDSTAAVLVQVLPESLDGLCVADGPARRGKLWVAQRSVPVSIEALSPGLHQAPVLGHQHLLEASSILRPDIFPVLLLLVLLGCRQVPGHQLLPPYLSKRLIPLGESLCPPVLTGFLHGVSGHLNVTSLPRNLGSGVHISDRQMELSLWSQKIKQSLGILAVAERLHSFFKLRIAEPGRLASHHAVQPALQGVAVLFLEEPMKLRHRRVRVRSEFFQTNHPRAVVVQLPPQSSDVAHVAHGTAGRSELNEGQLAIPAEVKSTPPGHHHTAVEPLQ
mmetsp:Transcript_51453/g.135794  ORF Transcript_51453/g.135794 Transcript_51453/m.135794 type:complete len:284 (+) Transcript_51453:1460-2311(+)